MVTYYLLDQIKEGNPEIGELDTLEFQPARIACCFIIIWQITHELMQAAHSLLQILMIGLEDVRRSRLPVKERLKLDYYDSCEDPEEIAALEKVLNRTEW